QISTRNVDGRWPSVRVGILDLDQAATRRAVGSVPIDLSLCPVSGHRRLLHVRSSSPSIGTSRGRALGMPTPWTFDTWPSRARGRGYRAGPVTQLGPGTPISLRGRSS